ADAGRAGYVDFRHISPDHIQAHEQHALGRERGADLADEPTVPIVEWASYAFSPGSEVAPVVIRRRNAGERVRDRLAVDHQHARIASLHDVRDIALDYGKPLARGGQGLKHDIGVLVIALEHKNRASSHAIQRLADDLAVLTEERAHFSHIA